MGDSTLSSIPGATGERMASSAGAFFRPYRSRTSSNPQTATWVQIDLGASLPLDAVRLYPYCKPHWPPGNGFPARFHIECSEDESFGVKHTIVDWSERDYPHPADQIVEFRADGARGRYVRLTVTRMHKEGAFTFLTKLAESFSRPFLDLMRDAHVFAVAKIDVLSEGKDIALHRPVSVDAEHGNPKDAQQLTRSPRPQGEGLVTDNPQNVTSPDSWRPVTYRAHAPQAGVRLQGGLFLAAMQNNIDYLLNSYAVDDLLRQFRKRAGKPLRGSKLDERRHPFSWVWEEDLAGSNAGRFLMGAGNTLQWMEHEELRRRLAEVVEGIAQCRQDNGYIMAYPEDEFFVSEHGAYTRAWVTHGLIDAAHAGNPKAFEMLRGYYDWYNSRVYLNEALRRCNWGPQGMVANTRLYFTPVGQPEDLQVLQRYFQENYWLEGLAARRADAIWQYPYDRPHSYLVVLLEAYLDLYRATGERRYLEAVRGGIDLYRENWQQSGGSLSIIEFQDNRPRSNPLYKRLGETCGSVFWILLHRRLHLLEPEEEQHVSEIEKSIYNVLLANQSGAQGYRYHTVLVGQKRKPDCANTCCEGTATRLVGMLPQLIYSLAQDGLYVNLFERSSIEWQQSGETIQLRMETDFPKSPAVRLHVQPTKPLHAKIRIRTPSWASGAMAVEVNGKHVATGSPGCYVTLDRMWSAGDAISFVLPIGFKLTRYTGVDQVEGRERYALEYGPLLMAALGAAEAALVVRRSESPLELANRLRVKPDQPLHFTAPLMEAMWVPYFEVETESFSCFPIIEANEAEA